VLPELPVPGPSVQGPATAGQTLLYHSSLVQEASQYLSARSNPMVGALAALLASTSTDDIHLKVKNEAAAGQPDLHQTSALAGQLIGANPAIFQSQNQWSPMAYPQNLNNGGYVNSVGGQSGDYSNANSHHRGYNSQAVNSATGNGQPFSDVDTKANLPNNLKMSTENHMMKATIKLNKMSKADQELLVNKGFTAFSQSNPEKAKELGVSSTPNLITPKLRRANSSAKYANSDGEASGDGDSDSDEASKKGGSRKFFRATEKEREEEKKKQKDEKRKRKLDDFEYVSAESVKRRRQQSPEPAEAEPEVFVPKIVTKKVERKLIPMIPKIDIEELMESNTFHKFNKTVELIFDNMEEVNMETSEENGELPPEILIPKYQLQDLASETAKLKSMGAMESIPAEKVAKLLSILELNIRDGSKVCPLAGDDEDEDEDSDKLWQELAMERVMRAADSSLTVLNILTSKGMSKNVYLEDVIDRVALFIRYQLTNTIYPSYDPVYKEMSKSKTGYVGQMKKKRTYAHTVRDKNILALYNKVTETVSLFAELVRIQLLTDTTVLHVSTLGVAPFFVENVAELQLSALRLVTNVFSKYEKHRKLLLDDILASIARLPSSKRSLRTYRLNADSHIQMLTALVLQLIQCVVVLPRKLAVGDKPEPAVKLEEADAGASPEMDKDVLINDKYNMAMATAHQFLTVFLKKCGSKSEDIDYRPLFENFVQDLLTTVNTPEWPAAELLLSLLGHVLREKFRDRGTEMALRNSSLEYLGVVAARLRKDVIQSKNKVAFIDSIIRRVKEEEEKESPDVVSRSKKKAAAAAVDDLDPEEERTRFLQRVLLDYLAVNGGETDHATMNARHFYICQWYRDANAVAKKPRRIKKSNSHHNNNNNKRKKRRKGGNDSSDESSQSEPEEEEEEDEKNMSDSTKAELFRLREERKNFLVSKIPPFGVDRGQKAQVLSTHIGHESAHLIVKYLSSKRPFFNSFNSYLQVSISGISTSTPKNCGKPFSLICGQHFIHNNLITCKNLTQKSDLLVTGKLVCWGDYHY
jgi:cohesin loading factor subunit SCC2